MNFVGMNRPLHLFICGTAFLLITVNAQSSLPPANYDNLTTIFGRFADIISRLEAKVSQLEREKETCSLEKRQCEETAARRNFITEDLPSVLYNSTILLCCY